MKERGLFLGCLLLLTACGQAPQTPDVATIDPVEKVPQSTLSNSVSEEDLQARLPFLSAEDRAFINTPMGRQSLLQVVAREKLIALAAKEEGLDKQADYLTQLTEKRLQLDKIYQNYAAELLENVWYEKQRTAGKLQVTDEEIKAYYDKYPYEMTIRQIIVDNAETADQLLRTLKSNRSRFKELARQYNIAPEVMRQEIAFMPGEFLPDIEVIAANSSTGSVQGFFKTAYGFHIIMKTGERKLSFQEAAPRIQAVLENKKLDKLIESLQNKYEVTIDETHE